MPHPIQLAETPGRTSTTLSARRPRGNFDTLSDEDGALGSAMQTSFKRIRSWQVPPNWSPIDWYEEMAAVGTAAAWQAVCEFDPARGVPLAGFGYSRIISRCLARYRKEWRYALHLVASHLFEETTIFRHPELATSSALKADEHCSSGQLRDLVGALSAEQRWLIKQLFWEERTETEVANALGTNQSTVNRRKQAILAGLRTHLRHKNQHLLHKVSGRQQSNELAGLGDVARAM